MPHLINFHLHRQSLERTMHHQNRYLWIAILSTLLHCYTSIDTITPNQSFKDGDILVSSGSNFAFGFFSPGNSRSRYIGIWYNKVSVQTVVWVGNRDNPIHGTSGVLSIGNSGNLALTDLSSNKLLWSTNVRGMLTSNSSFVQLQDTGNLVQFRRYQNTNILSWQSFDYPTNTLLPHMNAGVNLTSGLYWSLTSWKSQDDPGTGHFQYKMDLNGSPQFFLYQNTTKIFRSGPWNGIQLSGIPDMISKSIFSLRFVQDNDEVSLFYTLTDPTVMSRLVLNESGVLERLTWPEGQQSWVQFWSAPKDQCDYYRHCGPFSDCNTDRVDEFECYCLPGYKPKNQNDWYLRDGVEGCEKIPGEPLCSSNSSAPDGFIITSFAKVPDTTNASVDQTMELKDCADFCLQNCSCTAYSMANVSNGGSGCITWYGELIDIREFPTAGQDVYIRVTAAEFAQYMKSQKGSESKKLIIILVPIIAVVLLLLLAIWLVMRNRLGKRKYVMMLPGFNLSPVPSNGSPSKPKGIDETGDVPVFDLKTIISATDSFALANKIGQGGFGTVYKGRLPNGREIAIKRLSRNSVQGIEEFKNEVMLIARLQHRNLVRLLGFCIQQEEKMLVFEYLPNKGLDNFIFDKEKGALLDWRKRFEIILGIARGIVYLHRDSRLRIIHRDLKASNVLLDANMEPKISDFGMARIFGAHQMEANTDRVVGTYGYMSPEYAMQGLFSDKSDVFSYGVLLLEIISGRKNSSYFSDNTVNLIGYIWDLWREGIVLDIVDSSMGESYKEEEVGRCIRIGLLCLQEHAIDRPTMSEVLSMLCSETSLPSASPKQPAFAVRRLRPNSNSLPYSSSASARAVSVDNASITIVEAR